jgi:hypothetical protein
VVDDIREECNEGGCLGGRPTVHFRTTRKRAMTIKSKHSHRGVDFVVALLEGSDDERMPNGWYYQVSGDSEPRGPWESKEAAIDIAIDLIETMAWEHHERTQTRH